MTTTAFRSFFSRSTRCRRLAWLVLPLLAILPLSAPTIGCRSETTAKAALHYHCPMHPTVVSDRPGDCPICGMKLVIFTPEAPMATTAATAAASPESTGGVIGAPSGFSDIRIDPARTQLIGLSSAKVERKIIGATIRTTGRVSWDETSTHHVHAKYEAYVEELHADYTGRLVHRGEKLVELYSPELLAAQEELLVALRAKKSFSAAGTLPAVQAGGADLVASSRERLRLLDVSEREIDEIVRSGKARRTITLHSPITGFVVGKSAVHGMKVGPGDSLFDIADLSQVWVLADVYEAELPRIHMGQSATMTLGYWPGKTWRGKVSYVYPIVDDKTRTVKVRLEFPNPNGELKPDMFADVSFEVAPRPALMVPDDAVIDSGVRQVVFLVRDAGRLEPREVKLGERGEQGFEVLSGLTEGELVARGAAFLVDSESRLQSALKAYAPAGNPTPSAAPTPHAHEEKKP